MAKRILFCSFLVLYLTKLQAQIPTYFNLRERLTENGNTDGQPIRDARIELKVYILQNGVSVFEERHPDVKTNYDGFISIKVGDYNPAGLGNLDWQNVSKTIKIESRTYGSSGTYKITYEDRLPVAAFAQLGRPSNFIKPSGALDIFSDSNHPGIEIRGNHPETNFPYIDFSAGNEDFLARLNTYGNNFSIESKGGIYNYSATALNTFRLGRNPNVKGEVQLFSNHENAGVEIKGIYPYVDLGAWGSDFHSRIAIEGNSNLAIRTQGGGIELDAGSGKDYPQKGAINFHASAYSFNGGQLVANSGLEVNGGPIVANTSHTDMSLELFKKYYVHTVDRIDWTGNMHFPMYAIRAKGRMYAEEFWAYSDRRVKEITEKMTPGKSLSIIKDINIYNYYHKDVAKNNKMPMSGVIAQEVERIYPQAVSNTTEFIPDIYQFGNNIICDNLAQTLTITVDSLTNTKTGDILRLIGTKEHLLKVMEVKNTTIKIKDWPEKDTKEVFVYGKQVNDFRVVDYDRIFTLNVSATQALIQEVENLKKQVEELQAYIKTLEIENTALTKILVSLESRVGNIEKQLSTTTNPSTGSH